MIAHSSLEVSQSHPFSKAEEQVSIIRVPPPSDEKKTKLPGVSSKILEFHQAGGWNYGSNFQYHVADVCFSPFFSRVCKLFVCSVCWEIY